MPVRDLSGMVFNRLTVLNHYERINDRTYWLCKCSCGSPPKLIRGDHITSDHTQSCGCYDRETSSISGKICTNGAQSENADPLLKSTYKSWLKMKARCDNPKDGEYKRYGERGISYCSDWSKFENFLRDLGVKPNKNLTLERHNVDGNYCKDNCSWESKSQQAHNQRKRGGKSSIYKGVYITSTGRVRAEVAKEGNRYYLGQFENEVLAALAYDEKAYELFGDIAWLNRNNFEDIKEAFNLKEITND